MTTRRTFIRALASGLAVCATGCFGSFRATNWVLKFNRSLSGSKFVQWLVFLLLVIIPVYEVAVLVDVWVLNSLEFWFGGSASAADDRDERVVRLDDGHELHMRKDRSAGMLYTTLVRPDAPPLELVFEMSETGARVSTPSGELAAIRSTPDGAELRCGGTIEQIDRHRLDELDECYRQDGAPGAAAWAATHQPLGDSAA